MDYNADFQELKRYILTATKYVELAKNKSKKINEVEIYNQMKNIENLLQNSIGIKNETFKNNDKIKFKVLSDKNIQLEGIITIDNGVYYLTNPVSNCKIPYIYNIEKIKGE